MLNVVILPALADNYMYLISDGTFAIAVDPYDAELVDAYLRYHQLRLSAIWNTHHHHDHVGGNEALVTRHPNVEVVAHESDRYRVPCATRLVAGGDRVNCFGRDTMVIHTPGHSRGGISYHIAGEAASQGVLFAGDSIFGAGCGRTLEGTAEELYDSLHNKLAAVPDETKLCYGHNYTRKNLDFCLSILPEDDRLLARSANYDTYMKSQHEDDSISRSIAPATNPQSDVSQLISSLQINAPRGRHEGIEPTPTLGYERQTSLFFRVHEQELQRSLRAISPKDAFIRLRSRRNTF